MYFLREFKSKIESMNVDLGSFIISLVVYSALFAFIAVPVALVFYESFTWEGQFTLRHYINFFSDPYFEQCFLNSLLVALACVATTSAIGVPMAYILMRYDVPGRRALMTLATLPLIMPPFVGALAFKFLFGKHGTFNLLLMDYFGLREPINFIYGLHGIVLVITLHLYPLVMLNVMASLSKLDPSLEESAENLGATGFYLFRTVTFPLILPGFVAGALLVFIWAFADLGTPLIIGRYDLMAPQAFFSVKEALVEETVRLGIVMCVIMVAFSTVALAAMRKYVSLRQYAALTAGVAPGAITRKVSGIKRNMSLAFCLTVIMLSLLPHMGIFIGAFGKIWSLTPLPTEYTIENFKTVLIDTPLFLRNSLRYSVIATILDVILGSVIAYILIRKRFPGRDLLDAMAMMPFALPGIVIATGYLRAFRNPIPVVNYDLLSTWMIITLALSMRRLPYTVRSSYAALQQIHVSLEEASMNLGANKLQTFIRITVPLMLSGLLAGGILAFVNSITELSCSWLLSLPGRNWEPMTVGIVIYSQGGILGQAAAVGAILIIIVALCVAIVNKLVKVGAGIAFGA
jgi:iron(III) transport system permease protein